MTSPPFRGRLAAAFAERLDGQPIADALAGLLAPPGEALPVPMASERSAWEIGRGGAGDARRRRLCARAAGDLDQPWPVPLASAAARVHRDGDRDTWEQVAFARQRRLSRAAIAAAVTLDDRWIDEVADGAWLLCEQSSWCWPAHDDAFARTGSVLGGVDAPFVDLGAGEVAAQLAWIDHLLGAPLEQRYPGLRERIRAETTRRVLVPCVERRDWHWSGLDGDVHNWNPWILGNVLVAGLALLEHGSPRRAEVVAVAVEGLDRFVTAVADDGACDEGVHYWWEGTCRAIEALDVLRHATGGRLDAVATVPVLRATIGFPHRMHLGGDWYVNVADGTARLVDERPWDALHRAAIAVGDQSAVAYAAAHRHLRDGNGAEDGVEAMGLGRLLRDLTDATWNVTEPARPPLPRDAWLPSTEMLVTRQQAGSPQGLTLVVKGGHNGEHHNHNDVGAFIVASDGVPVVVDAGRPTYTAATFGPERYSIWCMQSDWHNVPLVRGVSQSTGRAATAGDVCVDITDEAAELALDLTAAYAAAGLRRWRRRVRLERPADRPAAVVIDDRWELERWAGDDEPATAVHLLLAGAVELGADEATVVPLAGGRPVGLRWDGAGAALTVRPLADPMLTRVWGDRLTRLDLDVTGRDRLAVVVTTAPGSRR